MPAAASLHHSLTRQDALPPAARRAVVIGVVSAQAVAAWALLQLDGVRAAVAEVIPVLIQPELAPPPPPPEPPPPPPPRRVTPPPKRELPIVAAPPAPAPSPEPFEVPQVQPTPVPVVPAPAEPVVAAAPPAPTEPRAIDIGVVRYLQHPVLVYPPQSRRLGEQGRVHVRVLVDVAGLPKELRIVRSSGFARLDEAALATVRTTRFKPYTENGVALAFWVVMPLVFEPSEN